MDPNSKLARTMIDPMVAARFLLAYTDSHEGSYYWSRSAADVVADLRALPVPSKYIDVIKVIRSAETCKLPSAANRGLRLIEEQVRKHARSAAEYVQ